MHATPENNFERSISRRRLLSLTGLGAAGFAVSGLLASCGNDGNTDASQGPTSAGGETDPGATGSGSGSTDGTSAAAPSGDPIRIGTSLALTGALSSTALTHKAAGDLFVKRLNAAGGLLGRPVEWIVIDDESEPDKAAAAFERLIASEKVDLISAPYGTAVVSAALQVAKRYGYLFTNSTGSLTYQYDYKGHFPTWSTSRYPNTKIAENVFDALEDAGASIKKVAVVADTFPGSNYIAFGTDQGDENDRPGAIDVAKQRGYETTQITYPITISDWAAIAAQIRDFAPDVIFNAGVGLDGTNLIQALRSVDFKPQALFSLWSSPGPLEQLAEAADGVLLAGQFVPAMPQGQTPEMKEIISEFADLATADKVYPLFETQPASAWMAWEYLVQAVEGAQTLDNAALIEWLSANGANSDIAGPITFNADQNNYPGDISILEQLQDGVWQSVWPAEKKSADLRFPL